MMSSSRMPNGLLTLVTNGFKVSVIGELLKPFSIRALLGWFGVSEIVSYHAYLKSSNVKYLYVLTSEASI